MERALFDGRRWLFTNLIVTIIVLLNKGCGHQHSLLNTPPVLYVPDRNWRIHESEEVGQILARVRAEDSENDALIFGLEPHFHTPYVNSNEDFPFSIDPLSGVVYLNKSLSGRAGENFFLYVTVSDGQLTAKNEVFVNILGKGTSLPTSSITNVVKNISQLLPSYHSLPGVQTIRGQPSNRFPPIDLSNSYPLNNGNQFLYNPIFKPNTKYRNVSNSEENEPITTNIIVPTNRVKLKRVDNSNNKYNEETTQSSTKTMALEKNGNSDKKNYNLSVEKNPSKLKVTVITVVTVCCGLFLIVAAIALLWYRKRLKTLSSTLKKKSKEEMTKISSQINLHSTLAEDRPNSMVMQHWNGPMAFNNRYVPWERDEQMMHYNTQTSQLNIESEMGRCNGHPTSMGGIGIGNTKLNTNENNFDKWEFPRHRLKFYNILGEGAFGQVWRCEANEIDDSGEMTTVAVKTLKENASEVEKKDLLSELEVMKTLEPHVNVIRLLGCCTEKDPVFVIIEYVNHGKLQTYLRNSRTEKHYGNTHGKSNVLTSSDLTSFMCQVAKGMDYLTSRGIIHRDLAARNILITDDHTCKVADFGFARDVITSKIYERKSEGKLPIRWMATESLYDNIFSVKSDIWSFGILMWEIVTLGSTPYPGISAADVMRKVRDGYRLEKPEHCRRELYNIMYYCWSSDPNERPSFFEVVQMLDKLLHTEMDYIELEHFPDHNYYNIVNPIGEIV